MKVDKYCEDGILFDVYYRKDNKIAKIKNIGFSIDYSEETVKAYLSAAPHCLDVKEVVEIGYYVKVKDELL
ncbi:hypothetical protein [Vagococcus intermedius]|uniref:Uncharacterized protein n=1 Tax=Vagococcus intermedius TaxID=2991418 RepID=A0AAF0CV90_9ENTE|nr:hypothetical protein [Vagococcus intermedius]WEG73580.1 hypothetical protein OL234_01345 [Vagococcus intermedius]WEG75662.1 hypothetical protein OL235_01350 [Vagococcus intermedius]